MFFYVIHNICPNEIEFVNGENIDIRKVRQDWELMRGIGFGDSEGASGEGSIGTEYLEMARIWICRERRIWVF